MSGVLSAGLVALHTLTVNASANGDSNFRAGECYVGVEFRSTGSEWERDEDGSAYNVSRGTWLTYGSSSDVWVEFIRTAGAATWDGIADSTRYQLSTTRSFGIDTDGGGVNDITGYFRFWDAASGGNILQTTTTLIWSCINTDI